MVKQTSAPRRRKAPLATPDRLERVQNASWELSAISECLGAIGRDLELAPCVQKPPTGATGNALNWLAAEIDRRCALIDEALA